MSSVIVRPGTEVTRPSDFGNGSSPGRRKMPLDGSAVTSRTSAPCTCQAMVAVSPSPPTASTSRRRFSATLAGWSAVSAPRLSDENGPSETPPRRPLKATDTPAGAPVQRSTGVSPVLPAEPLAHSTTSTPATGWRVWYS